ncbi:MAG: hypothetical protein ABIK10_02335 [candidate division WOR-3 bacterium]
MKPIEQITCPKEFLFLPTLLPYTVPYTVYMAIMTYKTQGASER